ncbi:MAG: hypothetical protein O3C60_14665 [Planctomycetota bacterium]|nr:hypothetical protein [Planctomycetota bacterium]
MMPRMLPVLTYAFSAGMVGEGLGYLVGPGRSATHKLDFELDRYSYTELGDRPDRITVATAANSDAFNK